MISFSLVNTNIAPFTDERVLKKSIILAPDLRTMDHSTWESYALQSVDGEQHTHHPNTLNGLQKTEFGEKAIFGLNLLIFAAILGLSMMIFPFSTDMTDLDSIMGKMKLIQRIGYVVAFFNLIGLILIGIDLKNFILEINNNRNQYNDNLTILAKKINEK